MKKLFSVSLGLLLSLNVQAHCSYLPQGIISAWAENRSLWEREVSYEAVFESGGSGSNLRGLRVTNLSSLNFLYEAGLRSGDTLLKINDVSVSDHIAFSKEIGRLTYLPVLELSLEGDKTITLINSELSNIQCNI